MYSIIAVRKAVDKPLPQQIRGLEAPHARKKLPPETRTSHPTNSLVAELVDFEPTTVERNRLNSPAVAKSKTR
jgi:hypothetical protein